MRCPEHEVACLVKAQRSVFKVSLVYRKRKPKGLTVRVWVGDAGYAGVLGQESSKPQLHDGQ